MGSQGDLNSPAPACTQAADGNAPGVPQGPSSACASQTCDLHRGHVVLVPRSGGALAHQQKRRFGACTRVKPSVNSGMQCSKNFLPRLTRSTQSLCWLERAGMTMWNWDEGGGLDTFKGFWSNDLGREASVDHNFLYKRFLFSPTYTEDPSPPCPACSWSQKYLSISGPE